MPNIQKNLTSYFVAFATVVKTQCLTLCCWQ